MNIQITSRKFRAKDSLKDFINDEMNSLQKYNDDILEANIVLSYTHARDSIKTAEIVLQVPGKILSVKESSDDFRKAVNIANNKLVRQLKKIKSKRRAKVR
jgi:putative sigma-54 modulation protein